MRALAVNRGVPKIGKGGGDMADFDRESMMEMFIFEMNQLIEQLEQTIVQSETEYNAEQINEIFRVMFITFPFIP